MGEAADAGGDDPPTPSPPPAGGGGGGGASASEKAISRSRNKPKEEFLEVKCESSGKTRRFAPGTEAGFAVSVINRKLLHQYQSDLQINSNSSSSKTPPPLAVHIEAFQQGSDDDDDDDEEEPITFGPNSLLLNYGPRWILHTVLSHPLPSPPPPPPPSSGVADKYGIPIPPPVVINKPVPPPVHGSESSAPTKVTKPAISLVYIGKIILAFILIFLLGAIFTLALDNLPLLISFISSSL